MAQAMLFLAASGPITSETFQAVARRRTGCGRHRSLHFAQKYDAALPRASENAPGCVWA